ncbi:MAG: hypothetical protein PHC66_01375 [Candidatus Nanoarchaeia archaeon]|nr:hypothetical protein [Candidatus Nanoarchaeia archaeon]MDD5239191.1 hypothetical protein [Candidatus Nanoarchaeia archaeon]
MEKTSFKIWKLFIAALLFGLAFSSASAVCTQATETFYYANGTKVDCSKSPVLSEAIYSQVIPMSLPLHFTFGMYDTIDIFSEMKPALFTPACGSALYGPAITPISCTTSASEYETRNVTRHVFGWDVEYDAVVIASKADEPVPMLIGRNMTLITGTNPFSAVCRGDSLCYTQIPLS